MLADHQGPLVNPVALGKSCKAGFVKPLVVGRVEINDVEGFTGPAPAQPADQFPTFRAHLRRR